MNIKIGRNTYDIVPGDKLMDNGACVQLLTQSKLKGSWGSSPHPVLSKAAFGKILAMPNLKKYPYKPERPDVTIYEVV